jgi:hypothetical protein
VTGFRAVATVVIVASVVAAVWVGRLQFASADDSALPIAPVRTGEFVAVIRTRGQIEAQKSVPVYAPLAQDLRIAWMSPISEPVERGEPMLRFDPSVAERDLIERRGTLERAQASRNQAIGDAKVAERQDERDLVDARLGVEVAELAIVDSEFVPRLEAEAGRIDLRVARQNLRQLEAEVAQRKVSRESNLASLERQVEDAQAWVDIFEQRIERMELRAPLTGYAMYSTTNNSLAAALSGGAGQPLRVGDQVPGGMQLATFPDLATLLIDVTVEEIDRGRMKVGDEVIVRIDALPDVSITTTLSGISPLAELSFDSRGRSFHAYGALGADVDARIRPGMNGSMDIVIDRIPDATIVPAQALFTRGGRPAVHVVDGAGFRLAEVEILARNPDEIAVTGLDPDARVALADPFVDRDDGDASGRGEEGS